MLLEWFGNLGIGDKITDIISGGFFIIFALVIYISRIKYEWEREELSEYWKKCHEDKEFKDLDSEKDNNKDSLS